MYKSLCRACGKILAAEEGSSHEALKIRLLIDGNYYATLLCDNCRVKTSVNSIPYKTNTKSLNCCDCCLQPLEPEGDDNFFYGNKSYSICNDCKKLSIDDVITRCYNNSKLEGWLIV